MKIKNLTLCLPLLLIGIAPSKVKAQNTASTFIVPGNKAYAEPFTEGRPGVNIPAGYVEDIGVLSRWRNSEKSVVWYIYQKPGDYQLALDYTIQTGKELALELTITPCSPLAGFKTIKRKVKLHGNGSEQQTFITDIKVPGVNYFRYAFRALSDPNVLVQIKSLNFSSTSPGAEAHQTEYLSTPSVHLAFSSTMPNSKKYNWLYQEILVPEGGDPLATYYMSLGFFRGYMGIQTNSPTERRVLFSVWDSKDAEHDKSMEKSDYVTLVDKGDKTTTNNFGGEGTGGQSYVKGANWITGKPVKFLMNIDRTDSTSAVISAWYNVNNTGWEYVASWRTPKETRWFDGFYSFLENYGYTNGQLRREAYYYNAWGMDVNNHSWINFNKVRFSNTDGRVGQRDDFEQGVSPKYPDRFYMAAGGYTPTLKTANEIPLCNQNFQLDLKPFEERVALALKNEEKNKGMLK